MLGILKADDDNNNLSEQILKLVNSDPEMTFMSATIQYCEDNSISFEMASKMLSKPILEKIKAEAIELKLLKGGPTLFPEEDD